ncbi:MAG TPA: selenocysteine-specific translation elongation factor [Acidimicrobiales bacterium]|nr:selenocysteine-specific translation elongation factor [Acidimicrobiales bacterium]
MRVVATAGHVDHGKSTLVRALTGTDPDRFAEEKARGLTIDLGFASMTLPSGAEVAFVDVPGHVRFLKNMLAGVGAVDACLFVVDAVEGWKPQSEEHLRILSLLGLAHGVVAVTKVGLVDADGAELAALEVEERVAGTFLAGAEVVAVDARSGVGLAELRLALDRLVAATPAAADRGRPRLWVDRSFAARGSGTVVTGTLTGGSLVVDDELELRSAAPPGGARRVRVRGLQSHGSRLASASPGRRLAVNLTGVAHHDASRGDALVRAGQWAPTARFDASLTVLGSLDHDVSRRGAHVLHVGSGEHPVRLRVLGPSSLAPGTTGFVRLHLPVALPLAPGDRFVLRESGRGETVGGGEVLDVAPVRPASKAAPDRSVDRLVAERGWVALDDLGRLTGGVAWTGPVVGRWAVSPAAADDAAAAVRAAVGTEASGLDERARSVLSGLDDLEVDGAGRIAVAGSGAAAGVHHYVGALEAAPFAPPTPEEAGADRAEVRDLVRRGLVLERDGMHFAASAVDEAARRVASVLASTPEGATAGRLREALGTSRKYALPLLNLLDAEGYTRRRGDVRIAGPKLRR